MVSRQFYYTISGEELFYFVTRKSPILCGFWRFINAYLLRKMEESEHAEKNAGKDKSYLL